MEGFTVLTLLLVGGAVGFHAGLWMAARSLDRKLQALAPRGFAEPLYLNSLTVAQEAAGFIETRSLHDARRLAVATQIAKETAAELHALADAAVENIARVGDGTPGGAG